MQRSSSAPLLAALMAAFVPGGSTAGGAVAQPAVSPALSMRLTDAELSTFKAAAGTGDCAAAFKVARHYSFVLNDFAESITWLRIAARCPAAEPKAELAYLLLSKRASTGAVEEVEALITEIRTTNPGLAESVRNEVRAKLGKSSNW